MKVLLVNGGPHREGCTYTALREIEDTLIKCGIETEIFWIGNKPISGCIACGNCSRNKKCVFDDVVNTFIEKSESVDGFIFGTPVHYAGACGAITSFMDRVFYSAACSGRKSFFKYKPAAGICSARRAGTTATFDQLNKYFGIMEMPIITSKYWNMVHGSTPEDVRKDEEGLQIMRVLGKNMAYFLKCIDAGKKYGVKFPEAEKSINTNFIR